jgi:hypothetical protein
MAHRYAVLWEVSDPKARPVGLVVEQNGFVLVEVRAELGIASIYNQPFVVRGPDMALVTYRPHDPQYFDHVIMDLSRSFIIRNEGIVSEATHGVVLSLLSKHVFEPLRREHQVVYCDTARTFPAVQRYRRAYYGSDKVDGEPVEPVKDAPVRGRLADLVAA